MVSWICDALILPTVENIKAFTISMPNRMLWAHARHLRHGKPSESRYVLYYINLCADKIKIKNVAPVGELNYYVSCTYIIYLLGNASSINPPIWRFLPGMDPMVDTLLVRDLDSIVSSREAHAVNMFLASTKVSRNKYDYCVLPKLVSWLNSGKPEFDSASRSIVFFYHRQIFM